MYTIIRGYSTAAASPPLLLLWLYIELIIKEVIDNGVSSLPSAFSKTKRRKSNIREVTKIYQPTHSSRNLWLENFAYIVTKTILINAVIVFAHMKTKSNIFV